MRDCLYHIRKRTLLCCCVMLLAIAGRLPAYGQSTVQKYIIKDGKMVIELGKQLNETALDSFISKFDLYDLDLKQFIKTNAPDSLQKLGWNIEKNGRDQFVISKFLQGVNNINNPAEKIIFTGKTPSNGELFPAVNKKIRYGYNSFRRKFPFPIADSMVTFYLRNNIQAQRVMLAGSFNDWNPDALPMQHTDSGWIAMVKIGPGKYWYKFIVDGNWTTDKDNTTVENDGRGNDNSVFYKPSTTFRLDGFEQAKKVFVAGSFNNWKLKELSMTKTPAGWQLPLYLAEGTYTYRFIVDGQWMTDPANTDRLPNEFNDFNSVIRIGHPYVFKLEGYTGSKEVMLTGSFNNWRKDELYMTKTADGWILPYTLGAGNYEYRFRVDGKWTTGTDNSATAPAKRTKGNAYLVIGGNYSFRLRGFASATSIFLAGDFNDWAPDTYQMQKDGDDWVLRVHLSKGKHLYKLVADGKWITDPGNKLWEQNEFGTGNSVIWFDE